LDCFSSSKTFKPDKSHSLVPLFNTFKEFIAFYRIAGKIADELEYGFKQFTVGAFGKLSLERI